MDSSIGRALRASGRRLAVRVVGDRTRWPVANNQPTLGANDATPVEGGVHLVVATDDKLASLSGKGNTNGSPMQMLCWSMKLTPRSRPHTRNFSIG